MTQEEVNNSPHCDSRGISAGNQIDEEVVHDHPVIDDIRMRLLSTQEILEIVGDMLVEVGIFALSASNHVVDDHVRDIG